MRGCTIHHSLLCPLLCLLTTDKDMMRHGTAPYGQCWLDGVLVPYKPEQLVLEHIMLMHSRGLGVRRIARVLKEAGVVGRAGVPMRPTTLTRIILRVSAALEADEL